MSKLNDSLQELKPLDCTKTEAWVFVCILQISSVLNHIDTSQVIQNVVL